MLCTLVHDSKLINKLQCNRSINIILLLTLKPIKANKWNVRWIPMSWKPYLNNQSVKRSVSALLRWDWCCTENMGKIVRKRLKYDGLHPWETEKFRSAYPSALAQWNRCQKGQKRQLVPTGRLRCREGEFLLILILSFPFPLCFAFLVFGTVTVCISRAQQWESLQLVGSEDEQI